MVPFFGPHDPPFWAPYYAPWKQKWVPGGPKKWTNIWSPFRDHNLYPKLSFLRAPSLSCRPSEGCPGLGFWHAGLPNAAATVNPTSGACPRRQSPEAPGGLLQQPSPCGPPSVATPRWCQRQRPVVHSTPLSGRMSQVQQRKLIPLCVHSPSVINA